MARVKSETLYGLLSRTQKRPDPKKVPPLDAGLIDTGTWAVVEMNSSDAEAAHHYVSKLIRTAIGYEETVLRQVTPVPKQEIKQEQDESESGTIRSNKGYNVLLIDELLLFDVNHFSSTVPPDTRLQQIGIFQEPDPFLCLGQ
jgi:hypothetical protein